MTMNNWPPVILPPPKRKVFISYYGGNKAEADEFVRQWATLQGVFIPKTVGLSGNEKFINSNDTDYVMGEIRRKHLGDSTVTIVLIGKCTHSRRYVDWELKASLRQGLVYTPNGLLGILLSSANVNPLPHLPERFGLNFQSDERCYARYRYMPTSASELRSWIEDAYQARTTRNDLIQNSADMMKYNSQCRVCEVTH